MVMRGKVYLVGAGPGDPGLITARGLALLQAADAVVHDRLVSPQLLERHRPDATLYDVGKVPGHHSRGRQGEICELLVALACAGKMVVRLKGGDPFIFGRGGEEAEACAAAGVPFEVIPGVTSPVAVPAYAGIPLTHRAVASSFAVVTGHEDPARAESRVDWNALARIDTLVILMGMERLPVIVERLLAAGRGPDTPVALISRGTYPGQRTVTGTLGEIAGQVERHDLKPPVTIVVGEVVRLRQHLRWFDQGPLSGRRILVPRTREKPGVLAERCRQLGAEVIEVPRLVVEYHPERIEPGALGCHDILLVTSPAALHALQLALEERNLDARALAGLQVVAAGPDTAEAFHDTGIRPDLSVASYLAAPITAGLRESGPAGRRVLLLRQAELPGTLAQSLTDAGYLIRDIAAYSARPAAALPDLSQIDAVVFASSGSVRALKAVTDTGRFEGSTVFCMGEQTARAARRDGWSIRATAPAPTFDSLVATVLAALQEEAHAGK